MKYCIIVFLIFCLTISGCVNSANQAIDETGELINETKVIQISRIVDAASNNVSYTGIGFKPSTLSITGGTYYSPYIIFSHGFVDTNLGQGCSLVTSYGPYTLNRSYAFWAGYNPDSNQTSGTVTSFDDDGFTVAWTKVGAPPTRTAYFTILAIK